MSHVGRLSSLYSWSMDFPALNQLSHCSKGQTVFWLFFSRVVVKILNLFFHRDNSSVGSLLFMFAVGKYWFENYRHSRCRHCRRWRRCRRCRRWRRRQTMFYQDLFASTFFWIIRSRVRWQGAVPEGIKKITQKIRFGKFLFFAKKFPLKQFSLKQFTWTPESSSSKWTDGSRKVSGSNLGPSETFFRYILWHNWLSPIIVALLFCKNSAMDHIITLSFFGSIWTEKT